MSPTPWPWILSEYETRHPITQEIHRGCEILCKDNNRVVAEIPDYLYHPEDVENQRADARLITAAPELLDALRACVSQIRSLCSPDDVPEQAIVAIAKVTGQ
ncbi:hypothetical protein [Pseudomonas aeruginosa]|uniref:hypothetical protein n=1 Tax=Pseudomonas aeruginosa TaxID=287 RepID=UPI00293610C7|nr:hypothetical protein [Pseudomonas aeruginosa]MDV2663561.1 hypothetical protein [Pseudomonas aeruginosa]